MIVKSQIAFKPFRKDLDNIDVNQKSLAKQEHQNKFKTEFCRNLEAGFCEFGDKCFFADCNRASIFVDFECRSLF